MNINKELRAINVDPASVTVEEAIELIKDHDIDQASSCGSCEDPEFGVVLYSGEFSECGYVAVRCTAPCLIAMTDEEYQQSLGGGEW